MDKQTIDVMFSSKTDLWATPQDFYDRLHAEFNFELDPCSNGDNAKCARNFTESDDGLAQDWSQCRTFMNPPYGKPMPDWIKKAYEESQKGATVVALIPARTDTRYWHDYVMKSYEIRLVKGRLKFGDGSNSAPFPSAVTVFKPGVHTPKLSVMNAKEAK